MEEPKQLTDKTPAQIETDAIEGNEIIAAWLGWIRREPGEYNLPNWWEPDINDLRLKGKFRGYPHQLKFHSSWDWLMPVVQKIEKLYHEAFPKDFIQKLLAKEPTIDHHYMDVIAAPLATPINEAYESVVAFIKWYSNQPQKAS